MNNLIAKKLVVCLVLVSFLCSFTNLYAVEDQFNVSLTVGADTSAPTTPTGLSATAISSSQIDLSWTASTDDVGVVGYHVYRDSTLIATSTATTYSDLGLSAETTYTYTVSAIDAAYNESSQSASASATTLAASVSSTPSTPSQPLTPVIYDIKVNPTSNSATVTWSTTQPTKGTLSWGLSGDYEIGASSEIVSSVSHSLTITNLLPGTTYQLKIAVTNAYGISSDTSGLSFTTLSLAQGKPNAKNFTATAQKNSILLAWENPATTDFQEVRIVKNENYFPADTGDGEVIYEGDGKDFTDNNVVVGKRYYYTLFVKYTDGTYSSGLIAQAKILAPGEVAVPYDPFDYLPKAPRIHPLINALTFSDFDFIQNGKIISTFGQGDTVVIDGTENLSISLDYQKVPEILKSIIVTLTSPTDENKTFSFLLRVNKDKTAYEATIGALGESGRYGVRISIIDYKNQGLKKITGNLLASARVGFEQSKGFLGSLWIIVTDYFLDIILLLILIYLIYRVLRDMVRRHRRNDGLQEEFNKSVQ